tara:strand:+ start:28 stop:372 length:345 start_codon:yes stop_codon:yes gene_type:complete
MAVGKTVTVRPKAVSIKTFNSLLLRAGTQIKNVRRSTVSTVYKKMPQYIKVVSFTTKMPSGKLWKLYLTYTLSSDDAFTYKIAGVCTSRVVQQGRVQKSGMITEWEDSGTAVGA